MLPHSSITSIPSRLDLQAPSRVLLLTNLPQNPQRIVMCRTRLVYHFCFISFADFISSLVIFNKNSTKYAVLKILLNYHATAAGSVQAQQNVVQNTGNPFDNVVSKHSDITRN